MERQFLECGACEEGWVELPVYPHPDVTRREVCFACTGSNTRPCMWGTCRRPAVTFAQEDNLLALCAECEVAAEALVTAERAEEWKRLEAARRQETQAKRETEVARIHREEAAARLVTTLRTHLPQVRGPARTPLAVALLDYQKRTRALVAAADSSGAAMDARAALEDAARVQQEARHAG